MRVLGIETSCDETGVAIYDNDKGIIANQLYSQIKLHNKYGGVVPELASREHMRVTIPLITAAIEESELQVTDIDAIAYTAGPGLVGSLMVGATIGRSLSYSWQIPAIPVNHLEGHLLTPMIEDKSLMFPFVALLVSGAHTQLLAVNGIGNYSLIGESMDDAAGEVLDKVAKLLNLPYPGGALLSNLAINGVYGRYKFPRPMVNKPGLDFSFSGLKTCVANTIRSSGNDEQTRSDIALAFEEAVVDTLLIKSCRALDYTGFKRLVIIGGVSSNHLLRKSMRHAMDKRGGELFYARPELCTDNGVMIAHAGMIRLLGDKGSVDTSLAIKVFARWPLTNLTAITL